MLSRHIITHLLLRDAPCGDGVIAVVADYCCCWRRTVSSEGSRYEKISNKSSFGIIDIAESSTSDRIIVIVDTACFIHDGAYR